MPGLIKEFIDGEGMTQRQFADRVRCTSAFANALVHGKSVDIRISLARRISRVMGIPMDRLADDLLSSRDEVTHGDGGG